MATTSHLAGLLAGLVFLGPAVLCAQVPELRQPATPLLSNAGMTVTPVFRSNSPIAVVDLNGDRRDDIVRLNYYSELSVELQTAPDDPFTHLRWTNIFSNPNESWKYSVSICAADVDRNGVNDFLIAAYDFSNNGGLELFLGDADGTSWTADRPYVEDGGLFAQGCIFADLDNDGHLDIFACHDIADPLKYMNDGSGGFSLAGPGVFPTAFPSPSDNEGNYAVIGTDYDNDGDVDYYLSKCRQGDGNPTTSKRRINRLFVNDGNGNYTDLPGAAGLADPDQTWCADFADIDNDGDLDCFVLNHPLSAGNLSGPSGPSSLYINDGNGNFSDSTAAAGLTATGNYLANQALFRDFNNDGFVDLLVTDMDLNNVGYGYYQNDGDGTFTAYGPAQGIFKLSGGAPLNRIHSFAVGDLNHDGHLDVYAGRGRSINTVSFNEVDILCLNQGNSNGFLTITLAGGPTCNPNGIGARIEAHGPWGSGGGPGVQVREVRGGESYGIMNSLNTHFGLGAATGVDQLMVRWPNGTIDTIDDVPGDRFVTVFEGTNAVAMDFADWIADFFPGGGPDAEPDADPDGDGTGNAAEQLLGTHPAVPDSATFIEASIVHDAGQDYLRLAVDRVPTQDVVPGIEFSGNASTWQAEPAMEVLEDTPLRYVVRLPVDLATETVGMARLTASVLP
ncbi:MAG: CRTAC1 family protein [Akkermansiaceae bacterium]|nr:CRTAC1 family protein [Akkermansiaceae bacterium]